MLENVRIIEIEGLGPGPFAGMMLADMGAEVIVVHRKHHTPLPDWPERPVLDRGKRSIALDLKNSDDVAVVKQLIATADGLIEGFRPGVMERLGLGPDECHALQPRLVYGRMTGWGQTGPKRMQAGHDLNYVALSGAAWFASDAETPPFTPPTLLGDIGGGALYLVSGLLAGIINARETGQGTVVDCAIYDGAAHMMNLLNTLLQSGLMSQARGQSLLDGPHWSRCYRTADNGYVSVQCLEPQFYSEFLALMQLGEDNDFQHQHKQELWPELTRRLQHLFAQKSRDTWAALFEGSDACVAPVLSPEEAQAQAHNKVRKTWVNVNDQLQAAPAPRFSSQPSVQQWREAPTRGQHTEEILQSLHGAAN